MVLMTKDGTPVWKRQYEQAKAYEKNNTRKFTFKFFCKSDADVIEAIEKAPAKADFVRTAIRYYMENHKGEE